MRISRIWMLTIALLALLAAPAFAAHHEEGEASTGDAATESTDDGDAASDDAAEEGEADAEAEPESE